MTKPKMLYRSLNPRALKANKHMLTVFLEGEQQGMGDGSNFHDRFYNCFIPHVERYLVEKIKIK